MIEKHLGKIDYINFGVGGYQESMFGLAVGFKFDHCGISDFKGAWDPESIECSEYSRWTEEDRDKQLAELCRFVSKIMKEAKVMDINKLVGKPVEITMERSTLKSWRILTEVL